MVVKLYYKLPRFFIRANIYFFEVDDRNTRKRAKYVVLVSPLLTSNIFCTFFYVSFVDFEKVNVCWDWLLIAVLIINLYFLIFQIRVIIESNN